MAGSSRTGSDTHDSSQGSRHGSRQADRGRRQLRRVALPVLLFGFLVLFGIHAARTVPVLPFLAERDIATVPMAELFTRADFHVHQAGVAIETASAEQRFLRRMRILLDAELAARKALALRPVSSEAWQDRAYAALKSGRTDDAERHTLLALQDGPFTSRFAPSRLSLGLRFWDSLSAAQQQRHYALIRKVVYYEPEMFVRGIVPMPDMVVHLRAAVGDDARLQGNIDRRLRNLGYRPDGTRG